MSTQARMLRVVTILLLLPLIFLSTVSAQNPSFSGSAVAATATKSGQSYALLDLSGGPQTFIDLHWGYLDYFNCGVNGVGPCVFVHDPGLLFDAGYNQAGGAPGCLGVCTYPGVPRDTYEGEGPSGTNSVQLDRLMMPTLGTPIGIQTSVTHDDSSSTSTCALGYFATPFGPYNGIVNPALSQVTPPDAMYQALDARSTATASCTPNGTSISYTFHHDYEKLGTRLPITPTTPWFNDAVCFDLDMGLPPFKYNPNGFTTPQPGMICFNQVLEQHTDQTSASITVATAVLTDYDGSQLLVCRTHADVSNCNTPPPTPPTLVCQAQGTGEVNIPYSSSLVASGGTQPYTLYQIIAGSLPNGLQLNPLTGEIYGTPTAAGEFDFTAQVTDTAGQLGTTPSNPTCHITVAPPPHLTLTKTPKGGAEGAFNMGAQLTYTIQITNDGGSIAKNVSLTDNLPGNGGLVWETATPSQGSCTITSNALSCSLGDLPAGQSITVTITSTATTPNAACTDQPNAEAIATAEGGLTAKDSGDLYCTPPPPQLSVVKTPKGGSFTMGGQATFTIVVSNPAGPGSQSATNVHLTDALPTYGGMTWTSASATQGSCTITSNTLDCSLGTIAPQQSVTVTVSSPVTTPDTACQLQPNPIALATSGNLTAQDSGSLTCTPPPPPTNVCGLTWGYWKNHISAWPLTSLILGSQLYSQSELQYILGLAVKGDASISLAHQLIAAKLNVANGTDINTANGAITAADNLLSQFSGKLPYGVKASSSIGQQMTAVEQQLDDFNSDGKLQPFCTTSGGNPPPPIALACSASTGQVNVLYSSALVATGGLAPYTYSVSLGSLPNGLTLNPTTGAITGTPTAQGTFNFTAKVVDTTGLAAGTTTASCGITVSAPPPPAPLNLTCAANTGQVGQAYNSSLVASGGVPPYTFSFTGSLPDGLSLNTSTGAITGSPTSAGTFNFTAKVTDSNQMGASSKTNSCSVVVSPQPSTNACGLTWGYWKNHLSAWGTTSLKLGSQTYSMNELLAILQAPVKGDASIDLAHQLIAAKLNVLNGTDINTANGSIAAADQILSTFSGKLPYGVKSSSTVGQQMTATSSQLDDFNSDGKLQPGCTMPK